MFVVVVVVVAGCRFQNSAIYDGWCVVIKIDMYAMHFSCLLLVASYSLLNIWGIV